MKFREYPELSTPERVMGAMLGLLAGDKNGGPSRMALELAESLISESGFLADDVLRRYINWYERDGFDTGPVVAMVMNQMKHQSNLEAVQFVDAELKGLTAGCNPLHRCLPLALFRATSGENELYKTAMIEAQLTHWNQIAGETSGAFLSIMTRIIQSNLRPVVLNRILLEVRQQSSCFLGEYICGGGDNFISKSGYAPEVLGAALHFVLKFGDAKSALDAVYQFAGAANYCPVIVGTIAGALWGSEQLNQLTNHCPQTLLDRATAIADELASTWAIQ